MIAWQKVIPKIICKKYSGTYWARNICWPFRITPSGWRSTKALGVSSNNVESASPLARSLFPSVVVLVIFYFISPPPPCCSIPCFCPFYVGVFRSPDVPTWITASSATSTGSPLEVVVRLHACHGKTVFSAISPSTLLLRLRFIAIAFL